MPDVLYADSAEAFSLGALSSAPLQCIQRFIEETGKHSDLRTTLAQAARCIASCEFLSQPAYCEIHHDGNNFLSSSKNFDRGVFHCLNAPLKTAGGKEGYVKVFLLKDRTKNLSLHYQLLNTLTLILANHLKHQEAENSMIQDAVSAKQSVKELTQMLKQHQEKILELSQPTFSVEEGVFVADRDLKIVSFSSAAEKITGFKRDEVLGKTCTEFFRAYGAEDSGPIQRTMQTGVEVLNQHASVVSSIGSRIPILLSTSVMRSAAGEICGGVGVFQDLSGIERIRREIRKRHSSENIVTKNRDLLKTLELVPRIAEADSTVLIEGASGTGKELLAKAIYRAFAELPENSGKNPPYIAVNCGALPDTLLESELFGYVKGAFTDARRDKPGRFQAAQNGILLLDEVAELPPATQVKLLRVLQERTFEPLGSNLSVKTNARIIAATNKNLFELVRQGVFREDLYYRLNIVTLTLSPLEQRTEDIPLLVEHFIDKLNARKGKQILGVSLDVMNLFMRYSFPGNIRELENILEHAFVMCRKEEIQLEHLPPSLNEQVIEKQALNTADINPLKGAEAEIIIETLKVNDGNRTRTAASLGIDKSTLWRKMRKHGIEYPH